MAPQGGKFITVKDGTKIFYHCNFKQGKARVLVFLHGLLADYTAWSEEREFFHDLGYSTLALDLRGHGYSGRPRTEEAYALERFADDVEEVIKHERIGEYVVIGHSAGGMVAMELASRQPKKLVALILVGSGYKQPKIMRKVGDLPLLRRMVKSLGEHLPVIGKRKHMAYKLGEDAKDWHIGKILKSLFATSLRTYLLTVGENLDLNQLRDLKQIEVPTLVIAGEKDTYFPPEVQERIAQRIKKATIRLLEDTDHFIVLSKPKRLAEEISRYLKQRKIFRP